jgi:hypothetical protein
MPTNVPSNRINSTTEDAQMPLCARRSNTETAVVTPLRQLHCVRLGGDLGPCDIRLHDYNVVSSSTHKSLFNTAPYHHTY